MSLLTRITGAAALCRHAARHARARRKQEGDAVAGVPVDAVSAALCCDRRRVLHPQGLDLTKETAGAPTVALSAVISGSAQFSIHGPEWTAIAASKGAPVDIIANVVNGAAVWIATAPDFKFDSIKDIKGQKVVTGLMPTTSTSLFIKLLKENGMDAKTDVEMIQVAIGSEPGPFVAKQADIAVMYETGPRSGGRQGHEGRARLSETIRRLCVLGRDRAQ